MMIKECYESFGGNYSDVLSRFRTEERIEKYLFKFLDDHSFQMLQNAMESGNIDEAFRGAHTLKGLSQNLGFDKLASSSSTITEALRSGDIIEASSLFKQIDEDYHLTISSIQEYMKNKK